MKYALVDSIKAEASKGSVGICQICGSELIAKCGEVKIHHWSHKGRRDCDPWWENETEWHRKWKNRFPESWQEVVLKDPDTKEKHVADVRTGDGFVLEFQYSHINSEEKKSRERFYCRMVWVLNGVRRKNDCKRFLKSLQSFIPTKQRGIFFLPFPEECFPPSWTDRPVPVFFDFEGAPDSDPRLTKNSVWGLLPGRQRGKAIAICVSKEQFVEFSTNGNLFEKLREINKFSSKRQSNPTLALIPQVA